MKAAVALILLSSGICFKSASQQVVSERKIAGTQSKVMGVFPGKENTKLYITYFPPGLGGSKYADSCIVGSNGSFEFTVPLTEPVLATISFDRFHSFDFITDKGIVTLKPLYAGMEFSLQAIDAISPLNEQYKSYKKFIRKEYTAADSLYAIRDRLLAEKKRDSLKLTAPALEKADSLLFQKNYDFVFNENCCQFIKSYVLYRKLMLRLPLEKLRYLNELLEPEAKESVYGKAVLEFMYSKTGLKIGEAPPTFVNQLSPEGKPIQISDFKAKYLLIDFWGSWCSPCRAENPALVKLYSQYKSGGFEILGVALEKRKEEWVKAIQQDKLPWPQVTDLKFWDSECVKLYGLYNLPFNVLLDKGGKIAGINLSIEALSEILKTIMDN